MRLPDEAPADPAAELDKDAAAADLKAVALLAEAGYMNGRAVRLAIIRELGDGVADYRRRPTLALLGTVALTVARSSGIPLGVALHKAAIVIQAHDAAVRLADPDGIRAAFFAGIDCETNRIGGYGQGDYEADFRRFLEGGE